MPTAAEKKRIEAREQQERAKDLLFMQNPLQWPGLVLPMKRGPQNEEVGFLAPITMQNPSFRLYKTNIFTWMEMTSDQMKAVPVIQYADAQAVQADGWRVD